MTDCKMVGNLKLNYWTANRDGINPKDNEDESFAALPVQPHQRTLRIKSGLTRIVNRALWPKSTNRFQAAKHWFSLRNKRSTNTVGMGASRNLNTIAEKESRIKIRAVSRMMVARSVLPAGSENGRIQKGNGKEWY